MSRIGTLRVTGIPERRVNRVNNNDIKSTSTSSNTTGNIYMKSINNDNPTETSPAIPATKSINPNKDPKHEIHYEYTESPLHTAGHLTKGRKKYSCIKCINVNKIFKNCRIFLNTDKNLNHLDHQKHSSKV